jgi:hypothetical protein
MLQHPVLLAVRVNKPPMHELYPCLFEQLQFPTFPRGSKRRSACEDRVEIETLGGARHDRECSRDINIRTAHEEILSYELRKELV